MTQIKMVKDGHLGGYVPGGDPGTWCPSLWSWAVKEFDIRSVLDVGCGEGHSARFFQSVGCEILGVDGCRQAVADSVIPQAVVLHDFTQGPFLPGKNVDLIWSCEFLEHVDRKYLANILETFAWASRAIFLTHAFPGQEKGHHHVNCRPSSYWIRHIEALGFECRVEASLKARKVALADYRGVNHFARSGLVFLKKGEREAKGKISFGTGMMSYLRAGKKAWLIHGGFRWSWEYREHKKKWKKEKRLARQGVERNEFRST